jgi:hypothetical protein
MAHTYEELKAMKVAQLREIADGIQHEALAGHSTMHKDKLLIGLCHALGIEDHEHHEVVGLDKKKVKAEIRALKKKRDDALAAKDKKAFKDSLREIHRLKNKLRRATV